MGPLKIAKIKCCQGCLSRSIEPVNCHSYCPTYLAERMALDEQNAGLQERRAIDLGIRDQRNDSYHRNARDYERRRKHKRRRK